MSHLASFRLSKIKAGDSSTSLESCSQSSPSCSSATASKRPRPTACVDEDRSSSAPLNGLKDELATSKKAQKKPRPISSSDVALTDSSSQMNGYGFHGMPSPDVVQMRLDFLSQTFPDLDTMSLQDTLKSCGWRVADAVVQLKCETEKRVTLDEENKRHSEADFDRKAASGAPKKRRRVIISEDWSDSDVEEFSQSQAQIDTSDTSEDDFEDDVKVKPENKKFILDFFNEAAIQQMIAVPGCAKKKAECIIQLRPFTSWSDLVSKFSTSKQLNVKILSSATVVVQMLSRLEALMAKCEKITVQIERMVHSLMQDSASTQSRLIVQPKNIPHHLQLAKYQLIGLNWLMLMHDQKLNGVLADEMGLGKTIQAIAFLAHLKSLGEHKNHLIIVPSSTLENWQREVNKWCPSIKLLIYHGKQDDRKTLRINIINSRVEYDVILTTYNMVFSCAEDRALFRKLKFQYVIFDEAHILKNMATSRYQNLMKINASRKLLMTGTPMQNNLIELMSLLIFVMPSMFANNMDELKMLFAMYPNAQAEKNERSTYETDCIAHAKRIMKPFFLRRQKAEVLTDLPQKSEHQISVKMVPEQQELYASLVTQYKRNAKDIVGNEEEAKVMHYSSMLMNLRKVANHQLLYRHHYTDKKLRKIASTLIKDPSHRNAVEKYIIEDLSVMSDFEIHQKCLEYKCIKSFCLDDQQICASGKFAELDRVLSKLKKDKHRALIFSQFTMVLDILEQYLQIRQHTYLRMDGTTIVQDRQELIDEFNNNSDIFLFILSTKAGGMGINLTSANTVIFHDIDFNPYNDKQAEDRCHRIGQKSNVQVIRLLSEGTIDEGMFAVAKEKLRLEKDLSDGRDNMKKDVKRLLKMALDDNID